MSKTWKKKNTKMKLRQAKKKVGETNWNIYFPVFYCEDETNPTDL